MHPGKYYHLKVLLLKLLCYMSEVSSQNNWKWNIFAKQDLPSDLAELQRRVLQAEATLERKEEENAELQGQLRQFETRWSEYDAKMKSMQDVWQKQMASLQVSLLVYA